MASDEKSKYEIRKARKKAGIIQPRKNMAFAYGVTPKVFAKKATEACKKQVLKDLSDFNTNAYGKPATAEGPDCWKSTLGERVARITESGADSLPRRLWEIERGEQRMVKTTTLEAMTLASGLIYGLDVQVPEIPGSARLAREQAEVYAEVTDPTIDVDKLADELFEFANACWQHIPSDAETIPDEFVLAVNNLEFLAQIKELVAWPTS